MQTDELAERVFSSTNGALEVLSIALGHRLGLYAALQHGTPRTATEVAALAGVAPRYAQEWLEQQTVAGLLEVDDPTRPALERRFVLPEDHGEVLLNRDSLAYLTPLTAMVAAAAARLPDLLDAYRTGGGVAWSAFGEAMRRGQADVNRPWYLQVLSSEWLPAVPGLQARLATGGRVADVGCGEGWSAIGIALSYPEVTVDGFDLDPESIEAARRHVAEHGLGDRVHLHLGDAAEADAEGGFDLVTVLECLHDMSDPVSVLSTVRSIVRADGTVFVMDERAAEQFAGPGDAVEQFLYGFSLLVCLPDGLSHTPSVGTGTVFRPETLRRYATAAGFTGIEVLPVENDLWRFYTLTHG
jgi:2-polyprenyl-3-methyl-5-hydroxy-6-metoxy-1,4-benzoquinol methylase